MTRASKPLLVALCAAWSGCTDAGHQGIDYSSTERTVGRWPAKARQETRQEIKASTGMLPADSSQTDASATDAATEAGNEPVEEDDAGASVGSDKPTTQSKPQPATDAGKAAPVRLTFSVLTHVQHMRLAISDPGFDEDARGPKNMGAIWIEKPDGSFVRTLEVWRLHKERARHLVGYNKVCQCPKPDVTATATLNKHREHTARWDLTDRNGAAVPEGAYTLHIEVADYDVDNPDRLNKEATNARWQIDFDTKAAPSKLTPPAAEFFTNLVLELQP